MNREQILKLLAALGVKIAIKDDKGVVTPKEGEFKEDDAVKLVEDLFQAGNLGLIQKRDELLEMELKFKKKIADLEIKSPACYFFAQILCLNHVTRYLDFMRY